MVDTGCSLQRLLTTRDSIGGGNIARLISRAFDGGAHERVKLFLRAFIGLVSTAATNAVADFRSTDLELGSTVTHLTNVTLHGSVSKFCVLGRVCRELALDRSIQVRYRPSWIVNYAVYF